MGVQDLTIRDAVGADASAMGRLHVRAWQSAYRGVMPTVHRPEDVLRERLPIGPPELFAEKLTAFAKAGVQRVFIWPVADEVHQLERFWNEVRPLVVA